MKCKFIISNSTQEFKITLYQYIWLYNQELPELLLGSKTPLQFIKDWFKVKPKLFKTYYFGMRQIVQFSILSSTHK